jgi:hypothetical protein
MMNYQSLIKEIRDEFPSFKLVPKDSSRFMKLISLGLKVITLGHMDNFMSAYTTTVGNVIYTPTHWDMHPEKYRAVILKHERIHLRQARKYGILLFSFLYLFFPAPMLLAWWRTKFEKEAYEETIRADFELYGQKIKSSNEYREFIIQQFVGASYGWMWPFRKQIEKWYDSIIEDLSN